MPLSAKFAEAVRLNLQATGNDDLWSAFLGLPEGDWRRVYHGHRLARLADEAVRIPDLAYITNKWGTKCQNL
ncbi:MAG: hypothetical protein NUV75_02240 [Gallionella sp.]|nr:hypothetical protein [Gallionella sp.]